MGTQQQLTTEQAELLILIKEIEDFNREEPGHIPDGGVGRLLVENTNVTPDELDIITETLEYYGYLQNDYELTIDGRQYVELLKEYLQKKTENPCVEHISFSLLNIEKLELSFAKIDILSNLGKWIELFEKVKKAIKGRM